MKLSTLILTVCIASGLAVLIGLGTWQMQRLAWKEALIERVQNGLSNVPISVMQVTELQAASKDIEYHPAFAEGTFDHDKESHYFATHKSKPGYFIYTPLRLSTGRHLYVNRGFVPMVNKDQQSRLQGLPIGKVKIIGLARSAPSEKPNSFVPNNDLAKNVFYWKSLNQMFGRSFDKMDASVERFFLDANNAPVAGGLPVGGVTRIEFPNSHFQYALTWYGLAGALFSVGGFFLWSRHKETI